MAYGAEIKIGEYVNKNPGVTLSQIIEGTGLDQDIVDQFIGLALQNRRIQIQPDPKGGEPLYFPAQQSTQRIGYLFSDGEIILKALQRHPGASLTEINEYTALGRNILEDFIPLMVEKNLIYEIGRTALGEIAYAVTSESTEQTLLKNGLAFHKLGWQAIEQGHYEEALAHFEQTQAIVEAATQHSVFHGIVLQSIAHTHHLAGNLTQAMDTYNQALTLLKDHDKQRAAIMRKMALVADALGDQVRALDLIRTAAALESQGGDTPKSVKKGNRYEFY